MLTILAETLLLLLACVGLLGMAYALGRAASLGWHKSRDEHFQRLVKMLSTVKLMQHELQKHLPQEETPNDK